MIAILILIILFLVPSLKLYKIQKIKLHEENLKRNKYRALRQNLKLNEEVMTSAFEEDKSYNFNKLNGFYDERKPIIRRLAKNKVEFYFDEKDKSVMSFLEVDRLDLNSILDKIPKLNDSINELKNYDYETYKFLSEEDIVFKDFISNRLELYEKSREYSMTTEKDLIEIQDYTQDILNNVIRFSQRRINHNDILKNFKY